MFIFDSLVHVANVMFVLSYSVRDILWLRLLTVVATGTLIPFYATRSDDLTGPIIWSFVFIAINVVQLYRLLLERRPARLNARQRRLYNRTFRSLTDRDFVRLLGVGRWEEAAACCPLVEQGKALDRLSVIAEGSAEVQVDGQAVTELEAGQFVGELSYVTGKPPSATVVTTEPSSCVHWPTAALSAFLKERDSIRAALQNIIGTDLANKLRDHRVSG